VFSRKPNPSYVAMPAFDEEAIRALVRDTLQATRGCRVEMILKDCHTIANDPRRPVRWVEIAREEAEQ
jgi:hypothetical protein